MKCINGEILLEDKIVARVENGLVVEKDSQFAPLYFQRSNCANKWLEGRAVDAHRTNSRLLKKVLRISKKDDVDTVLSAHAVTITDRYWFRTAEQSHLSWDEVRFKENLFANLALCGDPNCFDMDPAPTPELTNTGSYEKCWKREDDAWWLYKSENELEQFSEIFVSNLGGKLGFNMASYELDDGYIKSKDFTYDASLMLEPMSALMGDNEDYNENFNLLYQLSPEIAQDYIKLIYMDTICKNMDRHTNNYGLLRDVQTGKVLSLAPNFDNNISLIARGYQADTSRKNDFLIKLFTDFLKGNCCAAEVFKGLNIPAITNSILEDCINTIPIGVNKEYVKKFILNGQEQVREALRTPVKNLMMNQIKSQAMER